MPASNNQTSQVKEAEQNQQPQTPIEPPQKISLVWIFLGIGGVLLMWLISSKVF
ncbi:MAG: hypothetical protein PHE77_00915 [Candidatus Pacebacteria bacterium]|nr:hypothetical protein [Candidatus Paceibacterota bacterium]